VRILNYFLKWQTQLKTPNFNVIVIPIFVSNSNRNEFTLFQVKIDSPLYLLILNYNSKEFFNKKLFMFLSEKRSSEFVESSFNICSRIISNNATKISSYFKLLLQVGF
jgi:hypothetical protein